MHRLLKCLRLSTCACLVTFTTSSFSQIQQLLDAPTIANQALTASGQGQALLQGTIASGATTENGVAGTVVIETEGAAVRYAFSLGGQQIVSIYTGGNGWRISNGIKRSLPVWITQFKRANHIAALSRLADALGANNVVKLVGVENVNGVPAYHLRISSISTDSTPPDLIDWLSEFHVYVDPTSWLVLKTTSFDFSPDGMNNRSQVDTYFFDFRDVQGIQLPFHITSYVMNHVFSDMKFDSIQLGMSLPDSDFQ
jgi:hypothetical protein